VAQPDVSADPLIPEHPDVALVRAIAGGDRDALGGLYTRYGGAVMALLGRMLGSRAEAEELFHDVFVELWRRAAQYDASRGTVVTWVLTVTRSRAIDALRSRARRPTGEEPAAERTAPEAERPDRQAARRAEAIAVSAALGGLAAEQRQVLELAYFDGLSQSEIAATLGIPLGTVKSRTIAAMRTLRTALAVHRGGEP
jgi:RNA polymerase sigma-70 factor (ECF subfamily)